MKNILLLGAGRSASDLIVYLLKNCQEAGWTLSVGDLSEELALEKTGAHPAARCIAFDIHQEAQRRAEIGRADLVISLLPPPLHPLAARECVAQGRHLLTASYVTDEIQSLDAEARDKGVSIVMECGLDPGIDHMSAMQVLDRIRQEGGRILGFESFTGGLLAPEFETDNPWAYKFSWNPRNVVLAGQGTVKFLQEGTYKYYPYHRIFRRTEILHIPHYGYFEGYANRDSLKYRSVYGLENARTIYRGTLRRPGFCRSWDIFVQLGCTDDSYQMDDVAKLTHRGFMNAFLAYHPSDSVEIKLAQYLGLEIEGIEMFKLRWLGMFDESPVGLSEGTPAQILEHILKKKWSMQPNERDMIAMLHKFDYEQDGQRRLLQSHMVMEGSDAIHTAMSKTVGLPVGIAAKLLLTGVIRRRGVVLPVTPDLYTPILAELEPYGIRFEEQQLS